MLCSGTKDNAHCVRTAVPDVPVQNYESRVVYAASRGSGVVEYAEVASGRFLRRHAREAICSAGMKGGGQQHRSNDDSAHL